MNIPNLPIRGILDFIFYKALSIIRSNLIFINNETVINIILH